MADQSARLAGLAQNVEAFEDKLKDICDDLKSGTRQEERYADKIDRAKRNNDINNLSENIKSVGRIVSSQTRNLERAQTRNRDLETRNSDLETEISTLRNAGGSSTQLRDERRKNRDLTDRNQDLSDRVARLERENRNLRNQQPSAPAPTTSPNTRWFQQQIDSLKQDKADLQDKVARLETDKAALKTKKDDYKKAAKDAQDEAKKLRADNDNWKEKFDPAKWRGRNPLCGPCQRKEDHSCGGWKKFGRK